MIQPGLLSTIAFLAVVVFVIAAATAGVHVALRSSRATVAFAAGAMLWLAVTGAWVAAGGTRVGRADRCGRRALWPPGPHAGAARGEA
jgi:hypothetical protein